MQKNIAQIRVHKRRSISLIIVETKPIVKQYIGFLKMLYINCNYDIILLRSNESTICTVLKCVSYVVWQALHAACT